MANASGFFYTIPQLFKKCIPLLYPKPLYSLNKYSIAVLLSFFSLAQSLAQSGSGLKSHKPVYHYAMNQWTTQDGLSSNNINQVLQSDDGYLWVSSFNGLLRFDGVKFERFNIDNISFLNSNTYPRTAP